MSEEEPTEPPSPTRAIVLGTFADFWCEAAVLVGVFGMLDKILKSEGLTFAWTVKSLGCAIVFLSLGTILKLWIRP